MKISPMSNLTGQAGQALGSAEVGRTADPIKMERARAIARGETPQEITGDPQADRIKNDVRKIKMRTQRSPERDAMNEIVDEITAEAAPGQTQSSTLEATEPGTVEATQPLSPQFAALAKQKRSLQVKERELADREKALADAPKMGAEDLIARLKSRPLSVLQEHGVSYDQLTEEILSGQGQLNPEIQELRDQIKALKEGVDQSFQTRETQQEEAALTEMLNEAEGLAKEGDAFELIRERNAYGKVLRLIHSTYKQTGRVLDVREAMDRIEGQLLTEAEKLASINKVRNKFAPQPPQLQPQKPQGMTTLTARGAANPGASARARAIAVFNGTLKR